jgi:hypothetical protein
VRLPWEETSGLALERSDRVGLASFLTDHRACEGGIDVRQVPSPDGSMIRVTCRHCGRAIEALASSWEGWGEEQTFEAPARLRRFEPSHPRPARRRRTVPPPLVRPAAVLAGGQTWRRRLAIGLISAWLAGGVVLLAVAIFAR